MVHQPKSVAIIGNGLSRKNIILDSIKEQMPVYGCNALYREFKPDLLFAIDDTIINEIIQSSFPLEKFIVPPLDEQYEPEEYNPNRPRENTGMIAMRYAIKNGFTDLYCYGLDFLISNEQYNMGNVFDGTNGYGSHTRASFVDCINRTRYFDWFVSNNPDINFYIVFPKEIFEKNSVRLAPRENLTYKQINK